MTQKSSSKYRNFDYMSELSFKESRTIYEWKINNFDLLHKLINGCQTPTFFLKGDLDIECYLKIQLTTDGMGKQSCLITLQITQNIASDYLLSMESRFVNDEGERFSSSTNNDVCFVGNGQNKISLKVRPPSNLQCTLVCEITVRNPTVNTVNWFSSTQKSVCEEQEKLFDRLEKIRLDNTCTNVTIKVADREFKAHRVMLVTQSDVFAAMFQHETQEKKENLIHITDIEPEVFRLLLDYIYTGKMKYENQELTVALAVAADKYGFRNLENTCVKALMAEVTCENVFEMLNAAHHHQLIEFKFFVLEYILKNENLIGKPEILEKVKKFDRDLLSDVLTTLIKK